MKYSIAVAAGLLSQYAQAFPTLNFENIEARQTDGNENDGAPLKCTPIQPAFDAKSQYVSTSGKYAFVAPGPTDARGPCPGLNAAANHGYLPHNGVGSLTDFITSTYQVFGMAQDLSGFLAVYGAIFDGNLVSYSIGGPTAAVPSVNGLLGVPQGLAGSHNKYENDASPIRGDLYKYGNDYLSQTSLFQQFFNYEHGVPDSQANFGLDHITAFRNARFTNSIQTNPYFFNGPFSGAIASAAAYTFIYRFMANKSAEYPEGRLDRYSLMSFYAMSGSDGNFKYTPGHERIPENWYKRNPADDYTIPYFNCDQINQGILHPQFFSIGGNLGHTNSFVALDPGNLTTGAYSASTLAQGNNFACFIFELVIESAPDLLEGIYTDTTAARNKLTSAAQAWQKATGANCPQIRNLQYNQFNQYPGYTQSYNGYRGQHAGNGHL